MIRTMRTTFGPIFIGVIIAFIAFVFVFFGVFTPDPGMTGGSVGSVNGQVIRLGDFNRELNRRMEFFKSMNLTADQLESFGLKEAVFRDLVSRKLMVDEIKRLDLLPGDLEVRDRIQEMPVFQKDGSFDRATYVQVLQANQFSPGRFENRVRDDLAAERWQRYVQGWVKVTDEEVRREFLLDGNKRKLRYVLLTTDVVKKSLTIPQAEVTEYLKDETRRNLVRSRFDAQAATLYQGKKYEAVESEIAREIIASEKTEELAQLNEKLANEAAAMLRASAGSDAAVNAHLAKYGVKVQKSEQFTQRETWIPGLGEVPELMKDAFADPSPLDPRTGGSGKAYRLPIGWAVAILDEAERPNLSRLDQKEKDRIRDQIATRKEQQVNQKFISALMEKAKIRRNPEFLGQASS